MNKAKKRWLMLIVIAVGVCLIFFREQVSDGIREALSLSGEILIPSLLPFMVLSSFSAEVCGSLNGKITSAFMKNIFRLPPSCAQALFFGFVGGYPVGMNIASRLYEKGSISQDDALHLSCFCVNAGPAFIVTVVGGAVAGSVKAGFVILAATVTASLVTGLIYAYFKGECITVRSSSENKTEPSAALVNAVKGSQENMLSVCMWVVVFSVFVSVVSVLVKNETLMLVFSSLAEVTSGAGSAMRLGGLPFAAGVVSFGGLSVLCQLMPAIKKCGIRIPWLLIFRIINGILSYFIARLILCFVNVEIHTFADEIRLFSNNAPASAALLIMGAVFICDIHRSEIIAAIFHHRAYRL